MRRITSTSIATFSSAYSPQTFPIRGKRTSQAVSSPTDEFDAPVNVHVVGGGFGCRAFERVPGNSSLRKIILVERELGEG